MLAYKFSIYCVITSLNAVENKVNENKVWPIISIVCYTYAKNSLQGFSMKIKVIKKAFDKGNNLPNYL